MLLSLLSYAKLQLDFLYKRFSAKNVTFLANTNKVLIAELSCINFVTSRERPRGNVKGLLGHAKNNQNFGVKI